MFVDNIDGVFKALDKTGAKIFKFFGKTVVAVESNIGSCTAEDSVVMVSKSFGNRGGKRRNTGTNSGRVGLLEKSERVIDSVKLYKVFAIAVGFRKKSGELRSNFGKKTLLKLKRRNTARNSLAEKVLFRHKGKNTRKNKAGRSAAAAGFKKSSNTIIDFVEPRLNNGVKSESAVAVWRIKHAHGTAGRS